MFKSWSIVSRLVLFLFGLNLAGCDQSHACSDEFAASGRGRARMTRWSFNPLNKKCESFIYGGFGTSDNNFEDEETCTDICVIAVSSQVTGAGQQRSVNVTNRKFSWQPFSCGNGYHCSLSYPVCQPMLRCCPYKYPFLGKDFRCYKNYYDNHYQDFPNEKKTAHPNWKLKHWCPDNVEPADFCRRRNHLKKVTRLPTRNTVFKGTLGEVTTFKDNQGVEKLRQKIHNGQRFQCRYIRRYDTWVLQRRETKYFGTCSVEIDKNTGHYHGDDC